MFKKLTTIFVCILTILASALGVVLLLALGTIISGFVLSMLWGWFIVPVFGLPELSIVAAVGISLTVRYLTYQEKDENDDKKKTDRITSEKVILILKPFVTPLLILLFGYIIHLFM
ncbi:MAG: hypothetical protein COU29_03720 [Candidatus Magasanikbacteria bacterium CG10_big_fil_rev_8_21_14_0_10_36_32]|uniref:Uncharacterized protein n=1 Tax=Candidatus Magasanikbacteria bacterium CG10_big_fil_rev_8_21_14_0_10_36_32 TaxID=1974646 RepID=A0A2M6W5U3_9BACT|nr:MAG: hypothetical protein COU29_03720 [Candidatus Magasanikbacteria bacterium CG10_big_fil_rev_8_21_14_0_10_36_32]